MFRKKFDEFTLNEQKIWFMVSERDGYIKEYNAYTEEYSLYSPHL